MNTGVYKEPYITLVRWNEYFVIYWQIEAEGCLVRIIIIRVYLDAAILWAGYPGWWRNEDFCNSFDIEALD